MPWPFAIHRHDIAQRGHYISRAMITMIAMGRRMKKIGSDSFRNRVIVCSLLMGGILLALMMTINLYSVDEQIERQIKARIDVTTAAYLAVLVGPLAGQDHAALYDILNVWKETDDLTYLVAMDAKGRRLAETGLAHDAPLPAPGNADKDIRHVRFDVNYLGQHYGSVQYGLSTDYLVIDREKLVLYNCIAALAGIFLFSVMAITLARHIIKPLLGLSDATKRIGSGDYDVRMGSTGISELDSLIEHFQSMALTVSSKVSMLEWQAQHDALTNAFNRRAFQQHTAELLDDSKVTDVTMLYIDLDQFKAINDNCGHNAGDILLTRIARLLESHLKDAFVARIGGDEFSAIVTLKDEAGIRHLAQNIIDDISNIHFEWEGQSYRVGASIGVASCRTLGTRSLKELMIAADTACFGAKELGRNRIQVYSPNIDYFCQRREELRSVAELDNMLAHDRFTLYHQRFSPLAGNRSSHTEILLRVRNNDGGIDTPANLIRAAERYNLMPYIDHWVIESACRQISQWEKDKRQLDIDCFGINVSGASLSDERFPDFVLDQIRSSGINPKKLCFEITESSAVANIEPALHFIDSVRKVGAAVALDDFGSGLSSFAYLKRFQADYLKVDGAFISNIDGDSTNFAIVKAIVTLARAHSLHTVAEYVHSAGILKLIREIGIDYAQGFQCHKPEPLEWLVKHGVDA
ncbi:MAG: EAL domain-containing protein [Azoarcus sp.]|jgi:diguanylate cyclase (GGDEF)-like protein|nr:EAL domain-containing protein [Azoarcus sp.]